MATFDEYWALLPEQNNVTYLELKTIINSNLADTFASLKLKKATTDFLCRCLRTVPLATSNILKLLPSSSSKEIYYIVLMELLDDFTIQNFNAILAILMNSGKLDLLELEMLPKLAKLMNNIEQNRLGLAFLNINDDMRDRLLSIEDQLCVDDLINKRRLFVQAIADSKHFIEPLINHSTISDTTLSNNVLNESVFLVKILLNFDQFQQEDHKKYLEIINNQFSTSSTNNSFKCNIRNELQRLFNLNELLIHIPNIRINASKFNVIDVLYENLSKIDSQLVHAVLSENSKFYHRFNLRAKESNQLTEKELYNNFLIVKSLLEVIMDNQHGTMLNESSVEKLKEVKNLLVNITSIKTFIDIVDITFSLIFIRWDNFTHNGSADLDRTSESGSEPNECSKSVKRSKAHKRSEKSAFICSAAVLDNIINLLKNVSQQQFHSDAFVNADDSVKKSFRRLYENINDAHWRVLLFYSNVTMSISRSTTFVNDDIKTYFNKHQSNTRDSSNASSDEEMNSQQVTSVHRRKPRKKNPLRKSADEKSLVISNSTEQEHRSDTLYRSISASERRCPVSRMLGSPEHLATVCLNNANFEATKEIVKANNLEHSIPAKELKFMENYNRTKQKLLTIFNKYNSYENGSDLNASTVERLKHVATIGFEASQTQSIITAFATDNEFYSNEETKILIKKLQRQYPFLKTFCGSALQASIAVDLIISLTNSYEICFNIFNMLTKLWIEPNLFDDHNITFGYLKFTKNICDCLQLYKSIGNNNFGVKDLMCNECYVLVPLELKANLEKEKVISNFQCLKPNEMDSLEKWKAFLKPFECIRGDVNYFNRIYSFLVNLKKLSQDSNLNVAPMDAMQTDLIKQIGEIVFVNRKLPSEIVEIVDNLNINLVYVLCMNMIPVISCSDIDDSAVTNVLIQNVKNDNFNHSKSEDQNFYNINLEVLNFIKKNNYLVAYLLQEYSFTTDPTIIYEQRYLKNVMALEDVKTLAALHGDNLLLSALSYDVFDVVKLKNYLENTENFRNAINIIQCCSERSSKKKGIPLKALQDALIATSLKKCSNNCDLIEQIYDINVKSKYLLEHVLSIESSGMAKRLIESILLHKDNSDLEKSLKKDLCDWLHNINIYEAITDKLSRGSWVETRELSVNSSEFILKRLTDQKEFELSLCWLKLHPLSNSPEKFNEFSEIFKEIILATTNLSSTMFKIVETLPLPVVLQFYDDLLNESRNLELLEYITDFLSTNSTHPSAYQQHRISLTIFNQMNKEEQEINWILFNTPLVIIEQYLMNSRHETISIILKSIKPLLSNDKCKYCYARRNSTYDAKSSSDPDFKISLSENDFGHRDHSLSFHCIDSLLKVYASKALDFRISETHSHSSNELLTHSMASLDSLCGSFVMPKVAPDRLHWIKDEDATHCMCCRRSAFTMLCRRHHCRRCGRVVCHACSTKRIEIPELYYDVQVRSCDDCYKQIESNNQRKFTNTSAPVNGKNSDEVPIWQFSGNTKHDILLREEFCFEYAPSVSLCLSILKFHSSDMDCVNFLLHHCRKFESLLRPIQPGYPNPEIDYALVTRMIHCLALAAKVRGGPPECDTIRDHGEIIQSIVHHGCESLMPMEPPNSSSLRTLRDSLVLAEKWSLALELSLKCGFATTGVMAAWGIACIRAGCFDTAREKFAHCLTKTGNDEETYQIISLILQESTDELTEWSSMPQIKRPAKSPPMLDEILNILEVSCHSHQPEVIARASVIKDSNTSLASNRSKKREPIPLHEPALNILHTLLSLKSVTRGIYDRNSCEKPLSSNKKIVLESKKCRKLLRCSRFYDECLYYLTRYGSHNSILTFLIKNDQLLTALKYFLYQNVDADSFINVIFLPFLINGKVEIIINLLMDMDETLLLWKEVIIKTCCYLEHKGLLNSLYHLQILLKDPVRASMTCVKFYSMNCSTYQELQNNSFHLMNAQKHLQTELELCQWEEISVPSAPTNVTEESQSILMKMDSRTLNSHINTIWRQMEVTKFLSKCEQNGCDTVALLGKISAEFNKIPTLFGTLQDKIQLAVLTIIAGSNINAGFGLAFRIIQDFNLSPIKVYGITAKYLSAHNRLENVEKLIENIKSNSDSDSGMCDEIISLSIQTAVASSPLNVPIKQSVDSLVRHVNDVGIKISCHIAGGQLKSAYLLAVQYSRFNDIKKVLRKAEQTNQQHIKKLCEKKLNAH